MLCIAKTIRGSLINRYSNSIGRGVIIKASVNGLGFKFHV